VVFFGHLNSFKNAELNVSHQLSRDGRGMNPSFKEALEGLLGRFLHVAQTVAIIVGRDRRTKDNFQILIGCCEGDYKTIARLDAIRNYVDTQSN